VRAAPPAISGVLPFFAAVPTALPTASAPLPTVLLTVSTGLPPLRERDRLAPLRWPARRCVLVRSPGDDRLVLDRFDDRLLLDRLFVF
jgi:hypothetical protein